MAAERGNPGVAALSDPLHPAVLRLVSRVAIAGRAHGCRVAVCGEAASDLRRFRCWWASGWTS